MWKDLGVALKIPDNYLDIIAADHVNDRSYSQQCCKAMLKKWMEINPKPTWYILQKAIDCLHSLSHYGSSESKYIHM